MIETFLVVLIVGSTAVLLAAELAVGLLSGSSAATRFSIRQVAVCSLLLLPVGFLLLPEVPLGFTGLDPSSKLASTSSSTHTFDRPKREVSFPSLNSPVVPASAPLDLAPPDQQPMSAETALSPEPVAVTGSDALTASRKFPFSVSMIAVAIWLVIAVALLTRTLLAHLRAEFTTDPKAESIALAGNQWLPAWVELVYSARHAVPITTGIWRRRIVLPVAAQQWPEDQLRMVLKHELAHVVRRDVLWQLITSIATSFIWFHPLVWRADWQLRLERERACDDQVITSGEAAEDYATVLVQLATIFSGRTTFSAGVISMAKKPIEQRLITILSPSTRRASSARWLSTLTMAIALLLVVVVCSVRPFAPVAVATPVAEPFQLNAENAQLDSLHFPSRLTGLIVDENDQPVAGAEVQLTATPQTMEELFRAGNNRDAVDLPVVTSDDSGKFIIDLAKLSTDKDFWIIQGAATAKNRPPASIYRQVRKGAKSSVAFRTLRFQPGKTIIGRVVPPAGSEDAKLISPTISVRPAMASQWRGTTVDCENDGRFSVIVPTDIAVAIQASADNFAGTGFEVLPQARDLKDIALLEGTTVKGKVLDRTGRPVTGVYVYSETDAPYLSSPYGSPVGPARFYRRCKTNANGEYQLKPQTGKIRVSLSSLFDPRSNMLSVSERIPPVVVPKLVDLAEAGLSRTINLTEAKIVQASGTIRWPDGSPVVGLDVDVQLMAGSHSTSVFRTKTDDNGKYVASIAENNESFISVTGAFASADQWLDAVPETTSDKAIQKSSQSLILAPLTNDLTGLDWKLSKQDEAPSPAQAPDMRELEDLFAAQRADRTKGRIRIAAAANEEEKKQLTERFAQKKKTHVASIAAFEAEHRGEFAGAVALASYIDQEQDEDLNAFADNYLNSPNADVVITDINTTAIGGSFQKVRKTLKKFSGASPHPSVQAASLFKEATMIANVLVMQDVYKQPDWLSPIPEETTKEGLDSYNKQFFAALHSSNEEQLLADFDAILRTLKTRFPKHGSTVGDGHRIDAVSGTYANELQGRRFTLAHLRSGQPLPHFTGSDVQGADFDSERLKGKVVLLFFASKATTDWMDFKKLKELKKRYAGRPFEIVSLMVDSKREDAKSVVDSGIITWQTFYDADQKLYGKWQFGVCQETLLVDHHGNIHRRAAAEMELDQTIDQLVKNAESE